MDKAQGRANTGAFTVARTVPMGDGEVDRAGAAGECLRQLAGVARVEVDSRRGSVRVTYDAAVVGFGEIQRALTDSGFGLAPGWWARLRFAWYRYLDGNARANAAAKGGSCCNRPTEVYGRRRHP